MMTEQEKEAWVREVEATPLPVAHPLDFHRVLGAFMGLHMLLGATRSEALENAVKQMDRCRAGAAVPPTPTNKSWRGPLCECGHDALAHLDFAETADCTQCDCPNFRQVAV